MQLKKLIIMLLLPVVALFGQEMSQTFLSLNKTGVEEFLKKYPEFDGRGTIVLILDTGVDQGLPGLLKTSTGEVKVIDVQDFTKQGDIYFVEADIDEVEYQGKEDVPCFVNEDKKFVVGGAGKLSLKPVDNKYFIGLLEESLWTNSGSGKKDINENGSKEDKFYFVTFKTEADGEQFWVVYFDTNGNGDLSDEKPLRNYKEKFDSFSIPNEKGLPYLTMGLNIFPEESRVNFHFDDGAHGTHCAGIAAGNMIGVDNLNGVAPGANVISLKLGNNNYAGGATVAESMKKCYDYAAKLAKERKEPIIINMSFGVGSEIEGHGDIEKYLAKLAKDTPNLYMFTSNGNEGTGISTAGLPSASPYIFSSGAVLAKEVASDVYGATIADDRILYFSSRGGEVPKPDVVSPGACTSTVPNWMRRDVMWGTSMASPYTTGVASLLLSAATQKYPDVKVPALFIYKVLRESAVPMEGYKPIDQGAGMVNIVNAWELLEKYIKSGELKRFESYKISSFAPNMPNAESTSLYIRNGNYLNGTEKYSFRIKRENFIDKKKFYRTYKLKSDSDWLVPIKKRTYIRNNQAAVVDVKFDKSKMTKPGMYNGKIYAYRAGKSKTPEFSLMATVIIPDEFSKCNNYRMSTDLTLAPMEYKRFFIKVPQGANTMTLSLASKAKEYTNSRFYLHDPDGRQMGRSRTLVSFEGDEKVTSRYYNLTPGVYEVCVEGSYQAKSDSKVNFTVDFDGLNRIGNKVLTKTENSLDVMNIFDEVKRYSLSGDIRGYQKEYVIDIKEKVYYEFPFTIKKGESAKTFDLTISKEDYNKVTDFAIMIKNKDGVTKASSGLGYHNGSISIRNSFDADETELTLVLVPAFAVGKGTVKVDVKEYTMFDKKETVSVKVNGSTRTSFYPSVSTKLECKFSKPETAVPADAVPYGKIYFKGMSSGEVEYELPVKYKF
ncbi:MAG: S8 family serine peptidase [Rhodothermaceae bacterium]